MWLILRGAEKGCVVISAEDYSHRDKGDNTAARGPGGTMSQLMNM